MAFNCERNNNTVIRKMAKMGIYKETYLFGRDLYRILEDDPNNAFVARRSSQRSRIGIVSTSSYNESCLRREIFILLVKHLLGSKAAGSSTSRNDVASSLY